MTATIRRQGYDDLRCRRALRRRGITPRIARRGVESSGRLGRHRHVVERSLAWLVGYRRLQMRYERRGLEAGDNACHQAPCREARAVGREVALVVVLNGEWPRSQLRAPDAATLAEQAASS